jgi:predicted transcriptional regulator
VGFLLDKEEMKMKKKRNHLSIVHDILTFIAEKKSGAKPTNILYKSNLSYQMLNEYLNELISKKMIEEKNQTGKRTYSLTERGASFLKDYGIIRKFTESYGLEE